MKDCNMILTERQQEYQHSHLEKLINMNILLSSNQSQIMENATFAYSPLGKAFEKQTEKQVGAIKFLHSSNKKDELKEIEGIIS